MEEFLERKRSMEGRRGVFRAEAAQPARTEDGKPIRVQVNIESVRDLDTFELAHTDGIGLLRTEFLYMERSEFPSEEEQYRLYYSGNQKQCSVYVIPTSTPGTLASEISMRFGFRGFSHLISTGCTSSTDAKGNMCRRSPLLTACWEPSHQCCR